MTEAVHIENDASTDASNALHSPIIEKRQAAHPVSSRIAGTTKQVAHSPLKQQTSFQTLSLEANMPTFQSRAIPSSSLSRSFPVLSIDAPDKHSSSDSLSDSLDNLNSQFLDILGHSQEQIDTVHMAHNTAMKHIATHHQAQLLEKDKIIAERSSRLSLAQEQLEQLRVEQEHLKQEYANKELSYQHELEERNTQLQELQSLLSATKQQNERMTVDLNEVKMNLFVSTCLLLKLQSPPAGLNLSFYKSFKMFYSNFA